MTNGSVQPPADFSIFEQKAIADLLRQAKFEQLRKLIPGSVDGQFQYFKDQNRTWDQLDFNSFMERIDERPMSAREALQSGDILASLFDSGSITADKMQQIIGSNIKDLSLKNINIDPNFRAFKAIVAKQGGDFTNIQSAIDFVDKLGGGIIFLKKGTYKLTADITLYSNIEIIGEDNDTTIIDFDTSSYSVKAVGTSGSHLRNIHLKNIQVKGSTDTTNGGVFFQYVDDFSIRLCKFANNHDASANGSAAVWLDNSNRGIVEDCYSDLCDRFIYAKTSYRITVRINDINNSYDNGIEFEDGSTNSIFNNSLEDCENDGIYLNGTAYSKITNNVIGDVTNNLINLASTRCVVGNNVFWDSVAGAIGILVTSGLNAISGNHFGANLDIGIHLDNGNYNNITGNVIADIDGADGILIDNTCDKSIVVGNQIGVRFTDNGTNTVSGNNVII